ncbi:MULTISPECIES: replication-relaxation family protein [unclassified Actinoplanes]|uniref:replication-relaxation family protein n=1 Tax=unclassified Actinoplanes TaxID=2626549 RepID=UPI000318F49E|nr:MULTISPECIES: replication-relaxation family protein [unclassified Actinoplanes]
MRDYTIANLLDEHSTLTTDQLATILFDHPTTCRHRLHALRRLRFVDRFIRNRPGAPNPACWVPGPLSARYVALARGDNPPTARALRDRQDRAYASPYLDHLLEANQFFVDLLAEARRRPGEADLVRWWSERTTAAAFGRRVHPDGHGVWRDPAGETGFFLELDRGTESLTRLVDKLGAYRRLQADGGPGYPVLFALPSRAREEHLHAKLMVTGVTVATCVLGAGQNPAEPVWWLAGSVGRRVALTEIPGGHGPLGPLSPGPAAPDHHPLALLTGVPLLP